MVESFRTGAMYLSMIYKENEEKTSAAYTS